MSDGIGIGIVVLVGLLLAAVVRARTMANLQPVIAAAARKHKATMSQSFLGMPGMIKVHGGCAMRMTLMSVSTSSPEGGGEMSCVDFDWPAHDVGDFRVRERSDARRNALPAAMMGGDKPFAFGDPRVDERFSCAGTDPEAVRNILGDAGVVESLISLPHGVDVHVNGGRCHVAVKGYPSRVEQVDSLFALSERLLDAARRVHDHRANRLMGG